MFPACPATDHDRITGGTEHERVGAGRDTDIQTDFNGISGLRTNIKIVPICGSNPDGIGSTEVDHFDNCPVCRAYIDMRDLDQVFAHVHDAEIEIGEGPEPARQGRVALELKNAPA